jgi:MFS family permease
MSVPAAAAADLPAARGMVRIVVAASLGTVFEYYDFLLYGSLATFFGGLFFPPGNETAGLLASLATFGAGFAVRPLGALVFGRFGDRVGRKATFLVTIILMGLSTALVGVLPTFAAIGWWAPVLLVSLRLLQGFAIGGEFGGAALYIAEHAPTARRGFYTSWIQTTGTMGFILSLLVVLVCRSLIGESEFRAWGWRLPFLVSVLLLALSVYIRARLAESPLFVKIRAEGGLAKSPILESFGRAANGRRVFTAIVVAAPMALTWYAAQFYSLVFLQGTMHVPPVSASIVMMIAMGLGIPLFLAAGALSDRYGRRRVMLSGMAMFAIVVMPAFRLMDAIGPHRPLLLIPPVLVLIAGAALTAAPGAAFLVELFPTRIRYTSVSLPYHLTSAWFGGFMPFTVTWLVALTANPFAGLWYPIGVSGVCLLLALWLMPETFGEEL